MINKELLLFFFWNQNFRILIHWFFGPNSTILMCYLNLSHYDRFQQLLTLS